MKAYETRSTYSCAKGEFDSAVKAFEDQFPEVSEMVVRIIEARIALLHQELQRREPDMQATRETTNSGLESVAGAMYPRSMKHLQQLIMDAEACAKSYGKKTWFLGRDKFQPAFDKFRACIATCAISLAEDGVISDPMNATEAITAISNAMTLLESTYPNWPHAFQFWRVFASGKAL